MAKLEPYKHGVYLWQYLPSLAAAVIFAIIFASVTVVHFIRLKKWRARFCIPYAIGGICTCLLRNLQVLALLPRILLIEDFSRNHRIRHSCLGTFCFRRNYALFDSERLHSSGTSLVLSLRLHGTRANHA